MKAQKLAFEKRYSDGSGVQYAVRLDRTVMADDGTEGEIEMESIGTIEFPLSELDWLLDTLHRIRSEIDE